jgi:hypothetical protein
VWCRVMISFEMDGSRACSSALCRVGGILAYIIPIR